MTFFDNIPFGFVWNSYCFCSSEGLTVQEIYGRACLSENTFGIIQ